MNKTAAKNTPPALRQHHLLHPVGGPWTRGLRAFIERLGEDQASSTPADPPSVIRGWRPTVLQSSLQESTTASCSMLSKRPPFHLLHQPNSASEPALSMPTRARFCQQATHKSSRETGRATRAALTPSTAASSRSRPARHPRVPHRGGSPQEHSPLHNHGALQQQAQWK